MTRRDFDDGLAAYGVEFAAWPPAEARAARALLLRSPACRRQYLHALESDPALARAGLDAAEADWLHADLAARLARTPQHPPGWPSRATQRGVALAACIVVGLLAGWYSAAPPRPAPLLFAAVDLTPFTGSGQ